MSPKDITYTSTPPEQILPDDMPSRAYYFGRGVEQVVVTPFQWAGGLLSWLNFPGIWSGITSSWHERWSSPRPYQDQNQEQNQKSFEVSNSMIAGLGVGLISAILMHLILKNRQTKTGKRPSTLLPSIGTGIVTGILAYLAYPYLFPSGNQSQ